MSIERLNIEEVDRRAEEILTEAKRRAEERIKEAKKTAREILSRPFLNDEIEAEKSRLREESERKIKDILRRYQEQAEAISKKAEENHEKAVEYVVKLAVGTYD